MYNKAFPPNSPLADLLVKKLELKHILIFGQVATNKKCHNTHKLVLLSEHATVQLIPTVHAELHYRDIFLHCKKSITNHGDLLT